MVIIELREALLDRALDQLDEAKKYGKKCKMAMCELEDTLYQCYESSKDVDEDYEEREDFEIPFDNMDEEDGEFEVNYRDRISRSGKRGAMRMKYHNDEDPVNGVWHKTISRMRGMRRR